MSYETTADFVRDRVADADAAVPVIDIAAFVHGDPAARAAVVTAVKSACEQVGFFVVTGHEVPDALIRKAFAEGRAFFHRPLDEKMCIKRPGPGISRGYNSLAAQSLGLTTGRKAPPDLMESLGFGPIEIGDDPYWTEGYGPIHAHPNLWPAGLPELRRAICDYWRAMEMLSARLMRIFALALDLEEDFFVVRSDRHVTNMRVNYYPAQDRPPEPGQLRAGAHSDYGAFTILKGENAPGGLEVLRRGGDWAEVPAGRPRLHHQYRRSPDALDQREVGFDGPPGRQSAGEHSSQRRPDVGRLFLPPNYDVEVRCFDSCMSAENPSRYPPITAGAHWRGKILASQLAHPKAS